MIKLSVPARFLALAVACSAGGTISPALGLPTTEVSGMSQNDDEVASTKALSRVIAFASRKRLQDLRGTKDPDGDARWKPTVDPVLNMDCYIDYDSDEHSYGYTCSGVSRSLELAQQQAQRLEDVVMTVPNIRDEGLKNRDRTQRHKHSLSGVSVDVDVQMPRDDARHPQWRVELFVYLSD